MQGVTELLSSFTGGRVVQISSIAAVASGGWDTGATLSEADWNDDAPALCAKLGAAVPPFVKYVASKAEAERAFWRFFDTPRAFDGVTLTPPFVRPPVSPLTRSTASPRDSRPRRGAWRARTASSSPG